MGALPKRRPSSHRQGRRRRTIRLSQPTTTKCPHCGAIKRPHFLCPKCGK